MARPRKFDETTRQALITDAAEQILTGGVESVSLRPLAAKHGCSTTAIYTMFGSRDALIAAVRDEAIVSYLRAQEISMTTGEVLTDLRALGRASRRWVLAYPELYRVILGRGRPWQGTGTSPVGDTERAEFAEAAMRPTYRLVRAGIEEGVFHDVPVAHIGASLWAGVHGWIAIEMNLPVVPGVDSDAAYDRHLRALLRAWCAHTPLDP
ncbi:TetR/AcrR family transcriptional regulator [Kocuria tytonis]|uniref:TetR/AcrR family transcriptional regulator n=1 Tax=Kocuria tytonis TaxID=2054280 RepID=A0A495A612_9MICC|nr:WHG domain-containing protein [Kocuria tytonis]RKQ35278.1 TetR/AcrR family transcriptional regulator [Kocuria tytonis]